MKKISSYLTFNGNCRDAMSFYQRCLGGELTMQTIGESPMSQQFPEQMQDSILHAMISNGAFLLYGSDMVPDNGLQRGNAVALMLDCTSEDEIRSCYENLSDGGEATHPLENTFWGALFGDLTDKYGNHWLLNYTKTQEQ